MALKIQVVNGENMATIQLWSDKSHDSTTIDATSDTKYSKVWSLNLEGYRGNVKVIIQVQDASVSGFIVADGNHIG